MKEAQTHQEHCTLSDQLIKNDDGSILTGIEEFDIEDVVVELHYFSNESDEHSDFKIKITGTGVLFFEQDGTQQVAYRLIPRYVLFVLLERIYESGFLNMRAEYATHLTLSIVEERIFVRCNIPDNKDLYVLSFGIGRFKKTVCDYQGAPAKLKMLEKFIVNLCRTHLGEELPEPK